MGSSEQSELDGSERSERDGSSERSELNGNIASVANGVS